MHTPQAPRRRTPRRLGAGLASLAVAAAVLAAPTGAGAAALDDFPQDLDFVPVDLVAGPEDVFAVGHAGTFDQPVGIIKAVGDDVTLNLGDGVWLSAADLSPDGTTLSVIGTRTDPGEDYGRSVQWEVDTETMTVTEENLHGFVALHDVAVTAAGTNLALADMGAYLISRPTAPPAELGYSFQPTRLQALDPATDEDLVVAGSTWQEGGGSVAALHHVSATGVGPAITLGPDGAPDSWVTGMDVDEVNGLVYVVSGRDPQDGPQEYGLNVIGEDTDLYVPLDYPVFSVAVSPDGETVYLPGTGVSAYAADRLESYSEDDPAPAANLGGSGFIGLADVAPGGRLYAVQDHDVETDGEFATVTRVHAVDAPGAPTGLQAVVSEWSGDTVVASWTAPTNTGGASEDSLTYRLTLQDQAGGDPLVVDTFLTEYDVSGLVAGHTYTVTVTATNGAFSSAPATTTYVAPSAVAGPSSVTVTGRLAVGQTLAVRANGAWPSGTELDYLWRTDDDRVLSRSATVTRGAGQLGRRVVVEVTGRRTGEASTTVVSAPSAKVVAGTLTARTAKIKGQAKVGRTLRAVPGAWTPGTRLTYRWTANGKAIKGATRATYQPTRAVVGKRIRVVVTGTKAGYDKAVRTSAPTAKVKR